MKSTLWVKRVVLVNGLASGKGRPAAGVKKTRTCLYIQPPKGIPVQKAVYGQHVAETSERPYNPAKNADQRKQFKRTLIRTLKPVTAPELVAVALPEPVVAVNVPAETAPVADITPVEVTA